MWQIIAGIKKFDIYGQILVVDGNWRNLMDSLGKLITSLAPKFGRFWTWMESDGDPWNLITSLAPKFWNAMEIPAQGTFGRSEG